MMFAVWCCVYVFYLSNSSQGATEAEWSQSNEQEDRCFLLSDNITGELYIRKFFTFY